MNNNILYTGNKVLFVHRNVRYSTLYTGAISPRLYTGMINIQP
jgi:hypothetical protein